MIDRREILDTAGTLGLLPHVVEKDYVLGACAAEDKSPFASVSIENPVHRAEVVDNMDTHLSLGKSYT